MAGIGFAPARTFAELQRARRAVLAQVAVFAAGAISFVPIANFTVTGLSVVCLLLVPGFLLMKHRGIELVPLVLAALGWISYIVSGLVNGVSMLWPNAIAPAAFSLYLVGLTVITGRAVASIATALAGVAAGSVVFFLIRGIELTRTGSFLDLWKYGIAQSVTILILYGMARKARLPRFAFPATLMLLGLASLGLNFRSHAAICLVSAAIVLTRQIVGSRIPRGWQFGGIAVFGIAIAYAMPIVARAGVFGPALQHKTLEQQATHLPLLLAARTEPPMSITAILERPLLGWGSAQKLTPDLYTAAEHLAVRMGFAPTFPFELYWRLPPRDYSAMHSIVLGSWVEGGVLAALLPLWLLVACCGLVWNLERYGAWAPLVVTIAVQGIWDLVYSPWTYNTLPVYACIALFYSAAHFVRPVVGDTGPP
ncbi:hypothetical protein [Rhodococcus tukisamuensis]|uniref:O-antigen ligase n=1 Tax=Rhodococcus tukisamuensis TaxID=168276 RepID=A0A1G7AKX6_9NOCA|nr:hypothetical protein [Rhodococcus tukisamuensis]SDE15584.1 hypothetical protein SAMN05444580_11126 [Rhodococcus tukisamuensis]